MIILYNFTTSSFMMLSDRDIRAALKDKKITIKDFDPMRLQPASYDILLGYEFLIFLYDEIEYIDPKSSIGEHMRKVVLPSKESYIMLQPQQLILGVSHDYIGVDDKHVGHLSGKNSLARLGLTIHASAGFIDPGNSLNITLELYNTNCVPIKLYPLMKIGQVAFSELKNKCEIPYGSSILNSKYFESRTVEASKMFKNYSGHPQSEREE